MRMPQLQALWRFTAQSRLNLDSRDKRQLGLTTWLPVAITRGAQQSWEALGWLQANSTYRLRFGCEVPDWACTLKAGYKLRIVRVASRIGMPLAARLLVRDEASDPASLWG